MAFQKTLPIRYHQQEGTFYCGPACAQMVLESPGSSLLTQNYLDTALNGQPTVESGWATAPDRFSGALNANIPGGSGLGFGLNAAGDIDSLARKIVWSIYHHDTPAIVFVTASHWLVVNGIETSAEPADKDDTSYSIIELDFLNPTAVPGSQPPPHGPADLCGSGGTRGEGQEHRAFSYWSSDYLYAVPSPSHWAGKFLAVCDPGPSPVGPAVAAPPAQRLDADQIIPGNQVGNLAIAGLTKYGLYQREGWNAALAGTKPGEPILVHRLDKRDSFYYIVPMEAGPLVTPVVVCIDGRSGNYQQAARTTDPRGNALANLHFDPVSILKQVLQRPLDLGRRGKLRLRPEAVVMSPTLVWRPCRESMSQYLPFHLIISGDHRIYVRVDGQVFTRLHTKDRGI